MEGKLARLSLDLRSAQQGQTCGSQPTRKSKGTDEVADSWEDDDLSSPVSDDLSTPTEAPGPSLKPFSSNDNSIPLPNPPPPTPISPSVGSGTSYDWTPASVLGGGRPTTSTNPSSFASSSPRDSESERKRPERTTATASRLIAGALGVKAPKKTDEQRAYERSVKEQEIKRRNKDREEQERAKLDDEKAKVAVWES